MARMGLDIPLRSRETTGEEEAHFAFNYCDRCVPWFSFRASSNLAPHMPESCTGLYRERHEGRLQGLFISGRLFQAIDAVSLLVA